MQTTPTHALGVVYRQTGTTIEYLLVRPQDGADEWLFPKGHIEPGEAPESAAVREVREETGVVARMVAVLEGTVSFRAKGEDVRAKCFLMEHLRVAAPYEAREVGWFALDEALAKLTYENSRSLLREADRARIDRRGSVARP
jgi:ADP-ribose pyrophosphatase YjhB (NUDIX family)